MKAAESFSVFFCVVWLCLAPFLMPNWSLYFKCNVITFKKCQIIQNQENKHFLRVRKCILFKLLITVKEMATNFPLLLIIGRDIRCVGVGVCVVYYICGIYMVLLLTVIKIIQDRLKIVRGYRTNRRVRAKKYSRTNEICWFLCFTLGSQTVLAT